MSGSAPSSPVHRGNEAFGAGRVRDAIALYNEAIMQDPRNVRAYVNRSMAHFQLGQWRQSASDAEEALVREPANVKAHYRMALALDKLGRIKDAAAAAREALKIGPSAPKLQHLHDSLQAKLRVSFQSGRAEVVTAAALDRCASAIKRVDEEHAELERQRAIENERKSQKGVWDVSVNEEKRRHDHRNWPRPHRPEDQGSSMPTSLSEHQSDRQKTQQQKSWEEVLGVSSGATYDEVRRAFRRRIVAAHPDKGGSASEFFELQQAYASGCLSVDRR